MTHQPYRSKSADANGRYHYSTDEDAVWGDLFARQMALLPGKIAPEFLDGVAKLGLDGARVPQVRDVDARLSRLTGAGATGVPAIIPPAQFFGLLAQGKFPVATFLRRREEIDYIEEPDIFHEVFGHCPMLANPDFAAFVRAFGRQAVSLGKPYSWRLFRLFWFTVEFGLVRAGGDLRAYGAGIASSPAELDHAMSESPDRVPFDLIEVLRTPYRIDILQPRYFVIDSFAQLAELAETDLKSAIDRAKQLGDLPAPFQSAA